MTGKDIIIIGAGVIGCSIALQLCRRGYRTINIDKNPDVGHGSTANSCAVVRFSYSNLDGVKLAYEGYHYWKFWKDFLGSENQSDYAKYIQCGHLVIKAAPGDRQEMLNHYKTVGVPYEEWSRQKLIDRMPVYDSVLHAPPKPVDDPTFWDDGSELLAGAIYTPDAGYVNDPQLAALNLRRAVEAIGGKFVFRKTVVSIKKSAKRVSGVVLDNGDDFSADIVINVAGPHSSLVNRLAGVEEGMLIKTKALRREVHHLPSPENFPFEKNGIVTSDSNIGIYFKPDTGNRISVGSGDPACDKKTWIDNPDEFDRNISQTQWETQVYRLSKRIPTLPIPNAGVGVVDLYDVTDDWTPIYDKSDLDGFYMAIGTSGHQFKNAGVVGALMADLIESTEAGNDQDANPLQFCGQYTNCTIDTTAFSRLRSLNTESSFSVRG